MMLAYQENITGFAFGKRLKGSITIDDGCARAVLDKGASILPAGIIDVDGAFGPGGYNLYLP